MRIFKGQVIRVQEAIARGQVQVTGTLLDLEAIKGAGRVLVAVQIEDDLSTYQTLPAH